MSVALRRIAAKDDGVAETSLSTGTHAAPHLGDRRTTPLKPARPQLGSILLNHRSIRPSDLVRALEIQSRQQARLGDILRGHGMASEDAVVAALAEQFSTSVIDTQHTQPDPRLIDALGPRRCLQLQCLPWSRAGACVVVACAQPDKFAAIKPELETVFGQVALAIVSESDLHEALIHSRRSTLRLMAETCVQPQKVAAAGMGACSAG